MRVGVLGVRSFWGVFRSFSKYVLACISLYRVHHLLQSIIEYICNMYYEKYIVWVTIILYKDTTLQWPDCLKISTSQLERGICWKSYWQTNTYTFRINQDVEDKKLRGLIIWQCKKCKASLEEKLQTPVKGPLGYITHDHRTCTNKDNLAGKKKLIRHVTQYYEHSVH